MSVTARIKRAATLLTQAETMGDAVFSTSLGLEDQAATDLIAQHAPGSAVQA